MCKPASQMTNYTAIFWCKGNIEIKNGRVGGQQKERRVMWVLKALQVNWFNQESYITLSNVESLVQFSCPIYS